MGLIVSVINADHTERGQHKQEMTLETWWVFFDPKGISMYSHRLRPPIIMILVRFCFTYSYLTRNSWAIVAQSPKTSDSVLYKTPKPLQAYKNKPVLAAPALGSNAGESTPSALTPCHLPEGGVEVWTRYKGKGPSRTSMSTPPRASFSLYPKVKTYVYKKHQSDSSSRWQ